MKARQLAFAVSGVLFVFGASARVSAQQAATSGSTTAPSTPATQSLWRYSQEKDEMRGTMKRFATLESENTLAFAPPYDGGARGEIVIRNSPDKGDEALIRISKGQLLCPTGGGRFSLKADDNPVLTFGCDPPEDGSLDMFVVREPMMFALILKKVHKVIIEAEFYREGSRALIFNTSGLQWEVQKPPAPAS